VHVCPGSSADVPDDPKARLVILDPERAHKRGTEDSAAMKGARNIFESRGTMPRVCRNSVVFLASDEKALVDLHQATAHYLAWKEVDDGWEALNLDAFQKNQAIAKKGEFDRTIDLRIGQTWIHALCPTQAKANDLVKWDEVKVTGNEPLAQRTSDKLRSEELLVRALGVVRLKMELDRIPLWRGNHVSVRQLLEDWSRYLYLPRLRDADVLLNAIRDGVALTTWERDGFAYADGYDEKAGRYLALRAGQQLLSLDPDAAGIIVRPEVAHRQLDEESARPEPLDPPPIGPDDASKKTRKGEQTQATIRRFHGRVALNPLRVGTDAGQVGDEIISNLAALANADVTVTLEISAKLPDGASDHVVRTVTENCRSLKFESSGFERE
jgi:hypothetical protein